MTAKSTETTKVCPKCKQTFDVVRMPHIVHGKCRGTYRKRNIYCSKKCRASALGKYERKKPALNTYCQFCGKHFYKPEAWKRKKSSPRHYCSKKCLYKQKSKDMKGKRQKQLDDNPASSETRKRTARRGPSHHMWRGGVTYKRAKGNYGRVKFVSCPQEFISMARRDGYVAKHRLIIAQDIGRPLTSKEVVHHINHVTLDNRRENLMLFPSNGAHIRYEHEVEKTR